VFHCGRVQTQKELDELHLYVQELHDKMESSEHEVTAQVRGAANI